MEEQPEAAESQEPEEPQAVETPVAAAPAPGPAPELRAPAVGQAQPQAQEPSAYIPPAPVGISDALKQRLAVYLPEEDVNSLADEVRNVAIAAAQQALQGRDVQEAVASKLNIPSSYLAGVRSRMPFTQSLPTPQQQVQAAVLMELNERALQPGTDLATELSKYAEAVNQLRTPAPEQPVTQQPQTPRPASRVEPLHPDAQPTRPAIQSPVRQPVAAGGRNSRREDPLLAHFPFMKEEEE